VSPELTPKDFAELLPSAAPRRRKVHVRRPPPVRSKVLCRFSLRLATGRVLTSELASSRETAAAWLSHLNWLFSGKGIAEAQTSSHLLQKLSRIGANLLRCLVVQVTIGWSRSTRDSNPTRRYIVADQYQPG
jgi:hypothetical protein